MCLPCTTLPRRAEDTPASKKGGPSSRALCLSEPAALATLRHYIDLQSVLLQACALDLFVRLFATWPVPPASGVATAGGVAQPPDQAADGEAMSGVPELTPALFESPVAFVMALFLGARMRSAVGHGKAGNQGEGRREEKGGGEAMKAKCEGEKEASESHESACHHVCVS